MGLVQWLGGYILMGIGVLLFVGGAMQGSSAGILIIGLLLILIGAYYAKVATRE